MMEMKDVFKALNNMNISLETIGYCFNRAKSSISNWIKGVKYPDLSIAELFAGIESCRKDTLRFSEEEFIPRFLHGLSMAPDVQKNLLDDYHERMQAADDPSAAYRDFLLDLFQAAVERRSIGQRMLEFDPQCPIRPIVAIGHNHALGVRYNGHVCCTGEYGDQQCDVNMWRNVVSVACGNQRSYGLKHDKTCIAVGKRAIDDGEIFRWHDIISIAAGAHHVLGLQENGTVVAHGLNRRGQCRVSQWKGVCAIAAGNEHSVALCEDGTVVTAGKNDYGQCDVATWQGITAISACGDLTVGLTEDGRVLVTGYSAERMHTDAWCDMAAVAAGEFHVVGLKKDGTVVTTGMESFGQPAVYKWRNIAAIYAGGSVTVGIDGSGRIHTTDTFIADIFQNQENLFDWKLLGDAESGEDDAANFQRAARKLRSLLTSTWCYGEIYSDYLIGGDYINRMDKLGLMSIIDVDSAVSFMYDRYTEMLELREEFADYPVLREIMDKYAPVFRSFYDSLQQKPLMNEHISYTPTVSTEQCFAGLMTVLDECRMSIGQLCN